MKLIDLLAQYKSLKNKIDQVIIKTILSGNFILGEKVENLEKEISKFIDVKYAIGVNSGTDALFLSLKALGIGKGDEVITTPFSFIATAEVIANCGAKPVFVDINSDTYNIDALKIKRALTKKTKAIIPVHLYGQMAEMEKITQIARKYKLFVIEDAAQALGAKQKINNKWRMAGSFDNAGCFSFFPTKNLGAFGDAGMITTNDERLAEKLKMFRNHGSKKKYEHEFLGVSSRLDEIQAAIILAKLPYLNKWNANRRKIAAFYNKNLHNIKGLKIPTIAKNNYHIYHQYTIRVKHRNALKNYLEKEGVPTAIHYPLPLHLQPAFKYLGYKKGDFPKSERVAGEVLSLPIYPELKRVDQQKIVKAIKEFFVKKI